MRRPYLAFVTVFWLTMMGLLLQREVLPNIIITNPTGYRIELTKDNPVRESWMGIYFRDKKIGFSNTVVSQDIKDGIAGYSINETALVRLNMQGKPMFIRIKGNSFFTENHRLRNFNYKLVSSGSKFKVKGRIRDGNLRVSIDTGTRQLEKSLGVKQNTLVSTSISPVLLFKRLNRNKELKFEIFDPVTFDNTLVRIKNIGKEELQLDGNRYQAYIFETDMSGIKTRTWMTDDGEVLKEESALGFTMYKESPEKAMNFVHMLSLGAQDLLFEFSLSPGVKISEPRKITYLKIEKNGSVMEIYKDEEPAPHFILPVPIKKDIPEEDFIQSKNEKIVELAKRIAGNERDSWKISKKILRWVYNNIEKRPTLSVPSSLDVLHSMRGDCNEHTVLFTALTRSLGIPTKMIAGLVYLDDAFYYHAWPKVYVGRWVNMDPTLGQDIADATHIPLLEGGLKEQLELIKFIGKLKIKILAYR